MPKGEEAKPEQARRSLDDEQIRDVTEEEYDTDYAAHAHRTISRRHQ